jgi:hypothetical protein
VFIVRVVRCSLARNRPTGSIRWRVARFGILPALGADQCLRSLKSGVREEARLTT